MGRSAVGKSTIVHEVAQRMGLTILKSYTTRAMRNNESVETSDHIFIDADAVDQYKDDMVAYTERVGYCSFATKQQILNSDFYIINPSGFYELRQHTLSLDVELIPIYITIPYSTNLAHATKRGDVENWKKNYEKESKEFTEFEKSGMIYYRILNDTSIDSAVSRLMGIVRKELGDICEK